MRIQIAMWKHWIRRFVLARTQLMINISDSFLLKPERLANNTYFHLFHKHYGIQFHLFRNCALFQQISFGGGYFIFPNEYLACLCCCINLFLRAVLRDRVKACWFDIIYSVSDSLWTFTLSHFHIHVVIRCKRLHSFVRLVAEIQLWKFEPPCMG